jgi:hypothetical protein
VDSEDLAAEAAAAAGQGVVGNNIIGIKESTRIDPGAFFYQNAFDPFAAIFDLM